ncbi:MAG TPA: efflux RND transporter periplasmic adaptor subunit [Chitinophagaceae bacterium]|nr:efflux RND transporter periplasmic adaptor subunit [Chitinophagaceae bacterium]
MKYAMFYLTVLMTVLAACRNRPAHPARLDTYYTCSMHPQVMQDEPGNCPICHMKLIQASRRAMAANEIQLSAEQIRLGNIHADTLRAGRIGEETVLAATVAADETRVAGVNARVEGRIDHLYVRNPGDPIRAGEPLYALYSEELNTAKQEYLAALESRQALRSSRLDVDRLLQSARSKLLLWGLSEGQLRELEKSGKASPLTVFTSPVSGYLTELPVLEGQYIRAGSTVARVTDLSTVWVEAQVYASQRAGVRPGQAAVVAFPDLPGSQYRSTLEFVSPEIAPDSRVNLVRVTVPNPGGQLRPGMQAYVRLHGPAQQAITMPSDAVLREAEHSLVWVQTAPGHFARRMVQTGLESGDRVAIQSGLEAGDVVVTSGVYLLNSEYIFQRGDEDMPGTAGMPGMPGHDQ